MIWFPYWIVVDGVVRVTVGAGTTVTLRGILIRVFAVLMHDSVYVVVAAGVKVSEPDVVLCM